MHDINRSNSISIPRRERRLNPIKKLNTNFILTIAPNKNSITKEYDKKSSLYIAMKPILIMAQCFALMPLIGVTRKNITCLKFKWFSLKMIYSVFAIFGSTVNTVMYIQQFIRNGKGFSDIVNIVFFLSAIISNMLFILLAKNWCKLSDKWLHLENIMKNYPNQPNIVKRFKVTTFVIMILAFGEHILSLIHSVSKAKLCPTAKVDPTKAYFIVHFRHIFSILPYSIWISFFAEIFLILATFTWNFTDLFVILMCDALAERLRQFNTNLKESQDRNEFFWKRVREDYTSISNLCRHLDNAICHIVTIAFANNLFFICVQLFQTLKPFREVIKTLYFVCSFGFLLSRTGALSAYCCWINDESKNVLSYLFEIPSEEYGIEASRLIQQISYCPAVITGSKYFAVTRSLCLQVAGAIITFELILFQLGPVFLKIDENDDIEC